MILRIHSRRNEDISEASCYLLSTRHADEGYAPLIFGPSLSMRSVYGCRGSMVYSVVFVSYFFHQREYLDLSRGLEKLFPCNVDKCHK